MTARSGAVISEQTFGETVADAYGVPFALAADGKWHRADASDPLLCLGDMALCIETSVAADGTGSLLKYGYIEKTGWTWALGQPVYFGATAGTLTQTKPTGNTIRYAGYPAAADALWFAPTDPVLAEYLSLDLPTGTQGDLLYHNGSAWVVLNPDTAGKILQTGGPGANPAWADLPDGMNRNAIINGNFDIWQRGSSFDSSGYTADMWVVSNSGGSASTVTRVNTPSDAPFDAAYHFRRAVITAPTTNHQFIQHRIEDVRSFAGHTVCFTFWAKVDAGSKMIYCSGVQSFGSGGSSAVWVPARWIIVTSEWQKFNIVFNIPSIVGKTIGAGSYLEIHFGEDKDFKLYAIEIAQVQLNIGDKPLPFAPRQYAEELALCQRYYRTWTQQTENGRIHVPLWPPMRVAPTMAASTGTISNITAAGFNLTHNAQAATTITASSEL